MVDLFVVGIAMAAHFNRRSNEAFAASWEAREADMRTHDRTVQALTRHWTAQELTLPDGSVFATVLETAMAGDGTPLTEAGRAQLVFWESMID